MSGVNLDAIFMMVPREEFLPPAVRPLAHVDEALPIGFGQTNSQPTTVRMMLGWLDAKPGHKILDVGSGSGWTSALLGKIVGESGRVFAIEAVPELVQFGRANCERLGITNAEFHSAGPVVGFPEGAPFDRVLVSAAADDVPEALLDQLVVGGKLVVPVRTNILEITKLAHDDYATSVHSGFVFVPLL